MLNNSVVQFSTPENVVKGVGICNRQAPKRDLYLVSHATIRAILALNGDCDTAITFNRFHVSAKITKMIHRHM
jgi:hypothetical protein